MKALIVAIASLGMLPVAAAVDVSVTYSEDFAETLEQDYGVREGEYLAEAITDDLNRAFAKRGIDPARVEIEIIDAKPNKPTMTQLTDEPGLDYLRSLSIGGMKLSGTAFDSEGNVLGTLEYGWFESDIRDVLGSATWTDAKRASDKFARKFAKSLAE